MPLPKQDRRAGTTPARAATGGALVGALPRLAHTSMQHRVYLELRAAVMTGAFRPGQAITIQELADAFGTSTMPIRDALRRLVAERAMTVLSNRSVALPRLTRERFEDLLRVRVALEGQAVEWAAPKLTTAELDALEALCAEMNRSEVRQDVRRFLVLNQNFHFAIYGGARSEVLMPVIEGMWLQVGPYINLLIHAIVAVRSRPAHHDAALEALKIRDGVAARQAIEDDLLHSAEVIRSLLDGFAEDGTEKRSA